MLWWFWFTAQFYHFAHAFIFNSEKTEWLGETDIILVINKISVVIIVHELLFILKNWCFIDATFNYTHLTRPHLTWLICQEVFMQIPSDYERRDVSIAL